MKVIIGDIKEDYSRGEITLSTTVTFASDDYDGADVGKVYSTNGIRTVRKVDELTDTSLDEMIADLKAKRDSLQALNVANLTKIATALAPLSLEEALAKVKTELEGV